MTPKDKDKIISLAKEIYLRNMAPTIDPLKYDIEEIAEISLHQSKVFFEEAEKFFNSQSQKDKKCPSKKAAAAK